MRDWDALPFDDEPVRPGPALSVTELTSQLKRLVERSFAAVAVEGEISNCRQWSSGHIYFTLKDDRAQLRAVLFRGTTRTLRFQLEDGMHVVARGRVSVYDAKGEYQLVCDALEPRGVGALQVAFEQLKKALAAEGLFDAGRKRPLPLLPRRIGVVTSLDGAAIVDILRVLTSRHPTARVVISPARVQGEGASRDLIRALRAVARVPDIDVVIVGRGGGSAEDLWAFNDEGLARAIAACPVPVISAVGHEVDFTIADFVADVRAATPSNAAEIVVERADVFCARIDRAVHRLQSVMRLNLGRRAQRADRLQVALGHWPVTVVMHGRECQQLALRLPHAAARRLGKLQQRLDVLQHRLARRDARRVAAALRARVVGAENRLAQLALTRRHAAAARAGELAAQLQALSPLAVLGRGYAVCWNASRTSIIRSSRNVRPGDAVQVTLADGSLGCRVEDARED